jgi:hypothetical protein
MGSYRIGRLREPIWSRRTGYRKAST